MRERAIGARGLMALVALSTAVALAACGHASPSSDPGPISDAADAAACDPGFEPTNGTCAPHFDECPEPATIAKAGGGCVGVGVPPDQCGAGFVADGKGGCDAVLPKEACPSGWMAVPGETTCREIAPCGTGTWGDIPVDASTVYVDRGYTGGAGDGSATRPFVTIKAAIDKAKAGSIVAIGAQAAKETYLENVILAKPVHLWGRCPALVEIRGVATDTPTVSMTGLAELHRLAVSGPGAGVSLGGRDAALQQVWIHDVGYYGVYVAPRSRAAVRDSLIERSTSSGVVLFGSELTIDASVIRDTRARADGGFGEGVDVDVDPTSKLGSKATVRGSLLERNTEYGISVFGSELTLDASVIRDTHPRADGKFGRGLDLDVERTTKLGSKATVQSALFERNTEGGIGVFGSELTLDASVIRDTHPRADGKFGRGLDVELDPKTKTGSKATVRSSLFERNTDAGIDVFGAELMLVSSVIRDTHARANGQFGRGLNVEAQSTTKTASKATVQGSLIERSAEVGVGVFSSEVTVEASVVRGTRASEADGKFGDGLVVMISPWKDDFLPASLTITRSIVRDNARAGLSTFGARLDVAGSVVQCNLFDVDFEKVLVTPSGSKIGSVDDLHIAPGNVCGCGSAALCMALSNDLEPPVPPER